MSATATIEMGHVFTKADRCDTGCGAEARVAAIWPEGSELLFCMHHANEKTDALVAKSPQVKIVFDDRPLT